MAISTSSTSDDRTRAFTMVRCGVCLGPIYYSPTIPPPPDGTPCIPCMDWAVKAIVKLHKRVRA